ncbi:MAG: hypothetical protein QOH14_2735, partial [Pseudonocardiales bacterium]|nr:hypothetical protein [Pseudonocardiales bacterium]
MSELAGFNRLSSLLAITDTSLSGVDLEDLLIELLDRLR